LHERADDRPVVLIDEADNVLGVGPVDADGDGVVSQLCDVLLFVHGHLG